MERESFENKEIADILNSSFIPIKLDREERPDLDRIYMNFVQATTGGGGWPLNVFLTPGLEPLFGGTYWPGPESTTAHRDHVKFDSVLKKMKQTWKDQRQRCVDSAKDITAQLKAFAQEGLVSREGAKSEEDGDVLDLELLDDAYEHFARKFDNDYGGFGAQPKFPTPVNLQFLLSLGQYAQPVRDVLGDADLKKAEYMATQTLIAMYRGGIKDQIGHGFARYSVTRDWSLPHFEKMLYDQAQLLPAYLDAYLITKNEDLLNAVVDITTYLTIPPLAAPNGGFYSSEDADSLYRSTDAEKREGAFYVWTRKELTQILGEREAEIAAQYWNVQENGNVQPEFDAHDELINQNVLAIASTTEELAKKFGLGVDAIKKTLDESREKLRAHREKERPRPACDDKIVLGWNGLAIGALARVSGVVEEARPEVAKIAKDAALKAARFVKTQMVDDKDSTTWRRVWRDGVKGDALAFADDYAFLISGLVDLYEATWEEEWLQWADELQKKQISLFWDEENGGFYSTADNSPDLILRLKDGMDNAEPSTNGLSARNLHRLSSLLADDAYAQKTKKTLHAFEAEVLQHPFLFAGLLDTVVASRLGVKGIVITGEGDEVDKAIRRIRTQTAYGSTVSRVWKDNCWLRERNHLVKHMDVAKKVVQICESGMCREEDLDKAQLGYNTSRSETDRGTAEGKAVVGSETTASGST